MQHDILLDIDGVMITAVTWRPVFLQGTEFYPFSPMAQQWLDWLLQHSNARIILTSIHRSRFNNEAWLTLFKARCPNVAGIQTMDDYLPESRSRSRLQELTTWVQEYGEGRSYVIIDDDTSLVSLPAAAKLRWVRTMPIMGLDHACAHKALEILQAAGQ